MNKLNKRISEFLDLSLQEIVVCVEEMLSIAIQYARSEMLVGIGKTSIFLESKPSTRLETAALRAGVYEMSSVSSQYNPGLGFHRTVDVWLLCHEHLDNLLSGVITNGTSHRCRDRFRSFGILFYFLLFLHNVIHNHSTYQ